MSALIGRPHGPQHPQPRGRTIHLRITQNRKIPANSSDLPAAQGDCPAKTPPKSALPACGFWGRFFLDFYGFFYGAFLRNPLELSPSPRGPYRPRNSHSFFSFVFSKPAETPAFWGSHSFPQLPSNSARFGNSGHTRKLFLATPVLFPLRRGAGSWYSEDRDISPAFCADGQV